MLYEVFYYIRKKNVFFSVSHLRHFSAHFCAVTDLPSCEIRVL